MVQDWGGPIGLTVAVRRPERVRALVVANTWAWPPTSRAAKLFSAVLGGPVGRFAISRWNVIATRLVPAGHAARRLTPAEMCHHTAPFPTPAARAPTHVFPARSSAPPRSSPRSNGASPGSPTAPP